MVVSWAVDGGSRKIGPIGTDQQGRNTWLAMSGDGC